MWCESGVDEGGRGGRTRTSRRTFVWGVEGIVGEMAVGEELGERQGERGQRKVGGRT